MEMVGNFKYLSWVMEIFNNNWMLPWKKLTGAGRFWGGGVSKTLGKKVVNLKTSFILHYVVVQYFLLFRTEKWVLTTIMIADMEGVHVDFSKY